MDELFLAQGKKDIYITSAGIPDATGLVAAGTKEMLITAISKMSATSGAFRFVDYDPTQLDVQVLSELVGLRESFVAPNYYIRGAITQLDSNVLSSADSAGVSMPYVDLAISRDQVVLGDVARSQYRPAGDAADHSGHVGEQLDCRGAFRPRRRCRRRHRQGRPIHLGLVRPVRRLPSGGAQSRRAVGHRSRRQTHARALLAMPADRPDQSDLSYRSPPMVRHDERGRTRALYQDQPRGAGYVQASSSEQLDPELGSAIARYQAEHDLLPNGRIDFDLYYRVMAAARDKKKEPVVAAAAPTNTPSAAPPTPPVTATPAVASIATPAASTPATPKMAAPKVEISTSQGAHPSFRVNDTLVVEARTSQDGFLYCYYQDSDGAVARIFPIAFSRTPMSMAAARSRSRRVPRNRSISALTKSMHARRSPALRRRSSLG